MLALLLMLQAAVDDQVEVEVAKTCARVALGARARCAAEQRRAAGLTWGAARIGDDTTPAAIGGCIERSRVRGAIDWTRSAACATRYARAHPAP